MTTLFIKVTLPNGLSASPEDMARAIDTICPGATIKIWLALLRHEESPGAGGGAGSAAPAPEPACVDTGAP